MQRSLALCVLLSMLPFKIAADPISCDLVGSVCVDLAQIKNPRPINSERLPWFEVVKNALTDATFPAENTYVRFYSIVGPNHDFQFDDSNLIFPIQSISINDEESWLVSISPIQLLQFGRALNNGDGGDFKDYVALIPGAKWEEISTKQRRRDNSLLSVFGNLVPLSGVESRYDFLLSIFKEERIANAPWPNLPSVNSISSCVSDSLPLLNNTIKLSISTDGRLLNLQEIAEQHGDHLVQYVPSCLKR
ncbi:hypothetical protein [Yoonia sp. 2307UL14-13]|uniref:hypothetical protein n=1 Tax=Yoonia sp. 2307UL14-13 TaxID=3126506 RepID=UPI0030AB317B